VTSNMFVALVFLLCTVSVQGAEQLNNANFDTSIAGKNAFVKFLAPW